MREGTEGPYVGNGGAIRVGTPHEVANEVCVNTAFGVERVVRDAFARAAARPRKKLTLVHKHNVLVHAGHLWRRTVEAVNAEFPDVTIDYLHVDAATIFLVTNPSRFDVIVTDNLFGDILTDLAAAITGGIGLAASAQHQPGPHGSVACSSRCTARPPTSPARARPTRPRRSSRSRCCSTTSGTGRRGRARRGGRRRRPRRARAGEYGRRPRWATTSPRASPADRAALARHVTRRGHQSSTRPSAPVPSS